MSARRYSSACPSELLAALIADADIERAAKELVERYGDDSLEIARERISIFTAAHDQSAADVNLRVLSAVETLLAGERS